MSRLRLAEPVLSRGEGLDMTKRTAEGFAKAALKIIFYFFVEL
jgi:hypothetical protein